MKGCLVDAVEGKLEEVESFEEGVEKDKVEEQKDDVSELMTLVGILSDVKDTIVSDGNLEGLRDEVDYVHAQLQEMETTDAVLKADKITSILDTALEKNLVALVEAEEERVDEEVASMGGEAGEELANIMSQLGFPEEKIEQVKSILNNEGEAYEVNDEEKKEIMKDETDYRQ